MISLREISKKFEDFSLGKISFDVAKGEYFVLLGESGVGKSLLLEILSGLTKPDSGEIIIDSVDVADMPIQNRGLGLVYQDQALFPHMTVRKNLAFPLKCRKLSSEQVKSEVRLLAERTGTTRLLDRSPETLSLGEAQRVALARTLATKPKVLLLDEPLASLDAQAKTQMRSFLREINRSGQTIIHVTHDYEEAFALADRIAVLEKASLSQIGSPEEIFQQPKSEFIANFVGIKNFYKGDLLRKSEDLAVFFSNALEFDVTTDSPDGPVNLVVDSGSVAISKNKPQSSARNNFRGAIIDIEPARLGIEVRVNIGAPIAALITRESKESMGLAIGDVVWVNFKASAVKVIK